MKFFLAILLCVLAAAAEAQTPSVQNYPAVNPGNVPAEASATNASAGYIGEFAQLNATNATAAITSTNASPTVITWTSNPFFTNCTTAVNSGINCVFAVNFTGLVGTSGFTNATMYFVDPASITANSFKIATSIANALAGTDINTTGTDSGSGFASGLVASGSGKSIGAINLTAGDWDCSGNAVNNFGASQAPTILETALSSTVDTIGLGTTEGHMTLQATFTTATIQALFTGPFRLSQNATSGIYLNMNDTFSGGATTVQVSERLRCRRVQ